MMAWALFYTLLSAARAFGAPCFTMIPQEKFEDARCAPLHVITQISDCKTGAVREKIGEVARFECKANPKRLLKWHKEGMFVAELEKSDGMFGYKVSHTYVQEPSSARRRGGILPADISATPAAGITLTASTVIAPAQGSVVPLSAPTGSPAHGSAPSPSPSPVVAPSATPFPKAESVGPAPAASPSGALIHPQLFKFSGLVDVYYAYNFNKPAPAFRPGVAAPGSPPATAGVYPNAYHTFDDYHDSFTLNLAKLSVSQPVEPVGFRIDLAYGPTAALIAANGTDASNSAVEQAYLSYKTPFGLVVDAGKFVTQMGFEAIEAQDNWNYSRSFGFNYAIPFWHSGVRLSYEWDPSWSASVSVVNGWNNFYETNSSKTYGGQLSFKPDGRWLATLNYISGIETSVLPSSPQFDALRDTAEGILAYSPTRWLKFAVDYETSRERPDGGTLKRMTSTAVYAQASDRDCSLSLRYELFSDVDGASYGTRTGANISAYTATLERRLSPDLKLRAEYRSDVADRNIFTDNTNPAPAVTAVQNVAILAGLLSF